MKLQSSKPFFSVVIPLYNKEKHILSTINTVLAQTFQDFEIVVVNDCSKDNSAKLVSEIQDPRVRLINQNNAGVSAARNTGIKEAAGEYIALLDADDLWLECHLENIHTLIKKYPDYGLYACAYKIRVEGNQDRSINVYGLPDSSDFVKIPNYFESVAYGDNLVCSSAVCIPKKIFIENDIWFPVGEKYGEDQYVWARIAVGFELAYCKVESAIYDQSAENNTISLIYNEIEPHQCFYMIDGLRGLVIDNKILIAFDDYVSKLFYYFPLRNMLFRSKFYGLKQALRLRLNFKHRALLLFVFLFPRFVLSSIKRVKFKFSGVSSK
jgi:glycosyltransferase involved in cell wall biosynthesis